ncbi:MAG: major capsid protein [Commensalibacter sp.]
MNTTGTSLTPFSVYDTMTLIKVVENLLISQTFLLDKFFKGQINSNTEEIVIDIDIGKRRMSPFVSPYQEGTLVESRGILTKSFKPLYVKDKRSPDLGMPLRRQIGQQLGIGSNDPMTNYNANLAREMTDQIDILNRRMEWMAAQALCKGMLLIKGEGFPEQVIDFGRSPELNEVMSGTSLWDDPNTIANPENDISRLTRKVLQKSGAQITDLIFTNTPWDEFRKATQMQNPMIISALRGNNDANLNMGPITYPGAAFMGSWGQYKLWLYNDWYVDENNKEQPMIPDGTILGVSDRLEGTRAYGVVLDPEIGYIPAPYVPKMWIEHDPAQVFLMMQSAPLVIPTRVNASFCATVTKGRQ